MFTFFAILLFFSLLLFPIGIWKPSLFFLNGNNTRKKFGLIGGGVVILLFALTGATAPPSTGQVKSETVTNPVVALPSDTPSPTIGPKHGGVIATVVNVVDGDTIKIDSGEVVRYIGIDTPETVDPSRPVQCFGKEASTKNEELVQGKRVELEKDVSEKDKYGRLLRYIWIDDTLINEVLVREGYAQSSSYPPDVKYQDRFVEAQRLAEAESKGLWGSVCAVSLTPTVRPTLRPTAPPVITTAPQSSNQGGTYNQLNSQSTVNTGGSFVCNCSKTCPNMSSCAEAQYQLNVCGCGARDADKDGIACDADCQ